MPINYPQGQSQNQPDVTQYIVGQGSSLALPINYPQGLPQNQPYVDQGNPQVLPNNYPQGLSQNQPDVASFSVSQGSSQAFPNNYRQVLSQNQPNIGHVNFQTLPYNYPQQLSQNQPDVDQCISQSLHDNYHQGIKQHLANNMVISVPNITQANILDVSSINPNSQDIIKTVSSGNGIDVTQNTYIPLAIPQNMTLDISNNLPNNISDEVSNLVQQNVVHQLSPNNDLKDIQQSQQLNNQSIHHNLDNRTPSSWYLPDMSYALVTHTMDNPESKVPAGSIVFDANNPKGYLATANPDVKDDIELALSNGRAILRKLHPKFMPHNN